jgi:hypothetical protein
MKAAPFRAVLAALAVVSCASAAHAQMSSSPDMGGSSRMVSFGIGGGVSVPLSDASDAFKTGYNGQGFVRFNGACRSRSSSQLRHR